MITQFKSMQGIKRKRRCQNQCDQHLFTLKNLKNNSKYDIKLTFCPKYQRQPLPPQHTFAEYNNDGLFYTSAFVLGVDKKTIAKNLQKEMLDHQKLIKQNCEKFNQIVFPRPNSKHTTCSVCKETYKNYYIHIFSEEHGQKIQSSPYNVYVKELCGLFKSLWDGCAQRADQQALNSTDRDRTNTEKKGSDQLNLDDILQQEDINSNPSRISKYLENDQQEEETVKQVVMKRPARIYEPPKSQKTQKVYEDRQSRKKNINFAAFFEDEPKKKIINDHREAISVSSKKTHKTTSIAETKSKEKGALKKTQTSFDDDPFIIEYNARQKRKQKKSYYYIKKKQRLERQQREREMNLKQQNLEGLEEDQKNESESNNEIEDLKQEQIQNNISKSEEEEYEKYLDQFHEDQKKTKLNNQQLKKTPSFDLKLFQEVQKKHYPNPLFQTLSKSTSLEKFSSISNPNKDILPQSPYLHSKPHSLKKTLQNGNHYQLPFQKKQSLNNEQKQQIIDKNKINLLTQNQLPLFHKFKNPLDKESLKESQPKIHRPTLEVFNQYEQKIREYQKQKDYNAKNKLSQKINPFQDKMNTQISSIQDQSTVKYGRSMPLKGFQQTYNYEGQKVLKEQNQQLKIQHNSKYYFPETHYKKPLNQKDGQIPMNLNPMMPNGPYPSPHPFYHPYGYPMPPYPYHLPEPQKMDRSNMKYGQGRQSQSYQRGYYYNSWQHPYYMPPPPGPLMANQNGDIEGSHKVYGNVAYNSSKGSDSKPLVYPPYPPYPGYPPSNYPPGYYHPPGAQYPTNQRGQYPHGNPNMRTPAQPNTSININFPMYLPHYHSPYQYQSNPQKYTGQQPSTVPQTQYSSSGIGQMKPTSSHLGGYIPNSASNLPPYAEYQEYKKRQNDRRK